MSADMHGVFLPELGSDVVVGLLAVARFLPPRVGDWVFMGERDFSVALRPEGWLVRPARAFFALRSLERL